MSEIGHMGELEVIEYLNKKKKHTIYIPLKDKGIDFISVVKNKFYQIQVKTSMFQKNSYFWFDLKEGSLIFSDNTFYIFVCKTMGRRRLMGNKHNFLIVPSKDILSWIKNGLIARKKSEMHIFNLFVYPNFKNKKWIYKNKGKTIDLTKYWNSFNKLEG